MPKSLSRRALLRDATAGATLTAEIEGTDPPRRQEFPPNSLINVTNEKDECFGTGAVATDASGKQIGRLGKRVCDW